MSKNIVKTENIFQTYYKSPLGDLVLLSDGTYLNGLYFFKDNFDYKINDNLEVFAITKKWLDDYFNGLNPNPKIVPIKQKGTSFQMLVWEELKNIPYGTTTTYGIIAEKIAKVRGIEKMSSQAIGNAIHNNPISIIVPCHRVIGKNKNLVGYAGGLDRKSFLLKLEDINIDKI